MTKLGFKSRKDALEPVRHSLAHLMAYAAQELYTGVKFGIGPVIENGFYYDFDFGAAKQTKGPHFAGTTRETTQSSPTPGDLPKIEEKMRELIRQNIAFRKKLVSKGAAREIFRDQQYKLELIDEIKDEMVSIYESGAFADLCKGPHVKSTKEIPADAFKLTRIAGAYWRGSEKKPMLTRIYGAAFADKKSLAEHIKLQEEAEKRDHRKLGARLDLFSFHDVAPGAPFWHPAGMTIIKELEKWWRLAHEQLGYLETSTPIMVKKELFETSGHWTHYMEDIFQLETEGQTYVLKPMNCPESALIYSSRIRSYKDLPMRLAEIGRLHRNELSGVLSGLFRVRQITMDDAHIYCAEEHLQKEINEVLTLIKTFYKLFGFKLNFYLATRPDDYMGDLKLWRKAEKSLAFALRKNKLRFEFKPKDGAFYGPKIDVHITDALKRSWQMATLQLDFQTPLRFKLYYVDEFGGKKPPIMIHRAIFGSFERFIGILLEHLTGNLPLWLAPEQIWIIPISSPHKNYARRIAKLLASANLRLRVRDDNESVSKKIRAGELQKIPYLLVVGNNEMKHKTVSVRRRSQGDMGEIKIEKFITAVKMENDKRAM